LSLPKRRQTRLRRVVRLSQLELLAAINNSATLVSAARATHITQPAASRLLRTLADELGIQLFERSGRTLRPTAAGKTLLQRASAIMADIDRIDNELSAIDEGLTGQVSIGCGVASCYVLIPSAIDLVLKSATQTSVTVHESPMDELVTKLREGKIDLLVGRIENLGKYPDLAIEDLYDPAMTVICGPDHPLASRRNLKWQHVIQQPWILPEAGTPMRTGIEAVFRREKMWPLECVIESSSIQTNVGLLNRRNLLWVLSEDIAGHLQDTKQIKILSVPPMPGPSPFMMAHMRNRAMSPAVGKLADALREVARKIAASHRLPRRHTGGSRRRFS
jgi:DNA-binding transcriptional LysR family regulator